MSDIYNFSSQAKPPLPIAKAVPVALVLSSIVVLCICGNILVILSVFTFRPLRTVQNFFIVSLAFSDMLVAIMVMPFHIVTHIINRWVFGQIFCQIFVTSDVLLCTSSILNLCAIALDRYWAISDPIQYARQRTIRRVLAMIIIVWVLSATISIPPIIATILGSRELQNFNELQCELSKNKVYVLYSACGSFYIPAIIMTAMYAQVFLKTRKRFRERARAATKLANATKTHKPNLSNRNATSDRELPSNMLPSSKRSSTNGHELSDDTDDIDDVTDIDVHHVKDECLRLTNNSEQQQKHKKIDKKLSAINQLNKRFCSQPRHTKINNNDKEIYVKISVSSSLLTPTDKSTNSQEYSVKSNQLRMVHSNPATTITISDESQESQACNSNSSNDLTILDENGCVPCQQHASSQTHFSALPNKNRSNNSSNNATRITKDTINNKPPLASRFSKDSKKTLFKGKSLAALMHERQKISLTRERRLSRTLGVIISVFLLCWLPFFVVYIMSAFVDVTKYADEFVFLLILWLGYLNSAVNPLIYTIFNSEFRTAFKRLLFRSKQHKLSF
ncbi:unnamed protein product [Didymodactylos carnosus]|uniref:G-protein coupled receptors family 1 profile domain-containing protein n=1 Tax=Didymodactylos carnosus TaxID=1234261 RepID=A0A813SCF4_9BILA|nr:unnamed protein product [Didymodactylos carnosus]CAF0794563.1 unnamed protein product [Didymodactylos carnosus]CAF3548750.1 unnamed protein product [Didymodactylos carnosus]CAF3578896.1 unnamed protein product [Didymodactylos carnosus]